MLWLYKRVIFGEIVDSQLKSMTDLKRFEILILFSLVIPIIYFGFYPEPLINTIEVSIQDLIEMYDFNLASYMESNGGTLIK